MEEEKKEEIKQETVVPSETVVTTPQEEKPKKNILLFVIISLVVLIGVGVLLLVLLTGNKDNDKPKENEQKEEEKEKEEEEEKKGYTSTLYLYDDANNQVCGFAKGDSCNTELATITTETPTPELITTPYVDELDMIVNTFVLYSDNGVKLYDTNRKKITKLNIDFVDEVTERNNYSIILNDNNDAVIGIGYPTKNGYTEYLNLLTGKTMYKNQYKGKFTKVNSKNVAVSTDGKGYLLSLDEEKEILSATAEYESPTFRGRGPFFVLEECSAMCDVTRVYDSSYKLIVDGNGKTVKFDVYNNSLYVLEGNNIKKYDKNGTLLSTSNEYKDILQIINNYVAYTKDGKVVLENIDDPTETKEIAKKGNYDQFTSGYYSREKLDLMGEKNKKEGIYLVIYNGYDSNGNEVKDSNGNYGIEYCYTSTKDIVEYPIKTEMGGRAKPVLYLYPTTDTKVDIKLAHPEYLTTTYPKYNNGWKVFAKPNGDLRDESGKYYYALYWDEKRYAEVDFSTGFYVTKENAIDFLEEKLTYIGLNDKERNEFIMYWLPILENNGKSLVYFELTEEREANNKLLVSPTPDSMLRVNIHIKKVNTKVDIKEEKLTSFERRGFTVVEWGGMTY